MLGFLGRKGKSIHDACVEFAARLEDIQLPLSPNDPVTKQLVNILITEKLHELLDSAFGPILPNRVEAPFNPWFDSVDNNPSKATDRDVDALLKLFSPTGRLFRILVELTVIDPDFFTKVRENWKNEFAPNLSDGGELDTPFGPAWFPIPVPVLCSTSFVMLAERVDANIVDLPVDRVPPFFTLPVWKPPFTTELIQFSPESKERYVCASVGPAMYLILRMLSFMPFAVSQYSIFAEFAPVAEPSWIDKALERGGAQRRADPASEPRLVAYFELVKRYVTHLCPRQPFSAKPGVEDVLGAAMLHSVTMMWQRFVPPLSESDRSATRDLAQMSVMLHAVPIIDLLLRTVPSRREDSQTPMGAHLVRTFDEVLRPATSLYRTAMRLLRQVLLSVPNAYRLPSKHLVSILRLVATLIDSSASKAETAEMLVVHRYEVFSVILADLLDALLDSPVVFLSANHQVPAVTASLAAALAPLADNSIHACLDLVSRELQSTQQRQRAAAHVQANVVLSWSNDDALGFGGPERSSLTPVTVGRIANRAAHLYDVLHQPSLATDYRAVISILEHAFPEAVRQPHAQPGHHAAAGGGRDDSDALNVSVSTQSSDASFATQGRRGGRLQSSVRYGKRIRLRDQSQMRRGPYSSRDGVDSSYLSNEGGDDDVDPVMSLDSPLHCGEIVYTRGARLPPRTHEMPAVLKVTEFLDAVIQFAQDAREVYRGAVPRCPRGHRMALDEDVRARGLWVCDLCNYNTDTPRLATAMGYPVEAETQRAPTACEAAVCERCCLFLDAPSSGGMRRFFVPLTESFLCPDCAARPFPRLSLRILASRRTYVAIAIVAALLCFAMSVANSGNRAASRGSTPSAAAAIEDVDDMW